MVRLIYRAKVAFFKISALFLHLNLLETPYILHIKEHITYKESSKRITALLLGLTLALALLFVTFEYSTHTNRAEEDEQLLADFEQDLDMKSAPKQDFIPAPEPIGSAKAAERIKPVDSQPVETGKPTTTNSPLLIGDGDGLADQANVSEAIQPTSNNEETPQEARIVEQLPEFPGGMSALVQWLSANLKYPISAKNCKIEGRVVVSFIVNTDGSISQLKLEHSVEPSLDREALRVMNLMPAWKPGMEKNKPCRTMVAIPIVFKL